MEAVKKPIHKVVYEGKDITADLVPYLTSISYTDKVSGSSDEITLTLIDTDGVWRNEWIPAKGDKIEVWMGYDDYMFPCGIFEVDELELSGPPDIVNIRAMAAPISKKVRTKKSTGHEGKTLLQLAETIAGDHGLTVTGEVNSEIVIDRVTQYRETDLEFLRRVSDAFGYVFSIRGDKMVYTSIYKLEDSSSTVSIHRTNISTYSFVDKTTSSYKSATVKHSNPVDNELIEGTEDCDDDGCSSEDVLEVRARAENVGQADAIAKAALHSKNTKRQTGRFTIEGNVLFLAGINVEITGFGRLSGKYQIVDSTHSQTPGGGYITNFNAKKVAEIDSSKWH